MSTAPLVVREVSFVTSVVDPGAELPPGLPQVAFVGRSNVGKSSLINTILGRTRKKIAHVSGRPGKTQALNFFRVNDDFFLVDLPGYGFAEVPESIRSGWKGLVEGYLRRPDGPSAVIQLLDVRRKPSSEDLEMLDFLAGLGIPALVAITKVDKLTHSKKAPQVEEVRKAAGLDPDQVVPFSSMTGEGKEALLAALAALLARDEGEDEDEGEGGA